MSKELIENEGSKMDIFDYWAIVKKYLKELLFKSWLILAMVAALAYYFHKKEMKKPLNYNASLTFMLNNVSAGVMSLEQSLGITTSNTNIDKLMELVKSRRLLQRTLLQKSKIGGVDDFLGNHYIDVLKLRETIWANSEVLKGYRFSQDSISPLDRVSNSVLNYLHSIASKEGFSHTVSPSQIVKLNFTNPSEEFAYTFLIAHYHSVIDYFIESTVEKQSVQYQNLMVEAEKLEGKVRDTEQRYAQSYDANQLGIRMKYMVAQEREKSDLEFLYETYYELVTTKNANRAVLETLRPIVQLMEAPSYPLSRTSNDPRFAAIIGGSIGLVLGILLVIFRKIGWDYFKEERARALRNRAAKRLAKEAPKA